MEGLHASPDQHDQLGREPAAGTGDQLRVVSRGSLKQRAVGARLTGDRRSSGGYVARIRRPRNDTRDPLSVSLSLDVGSYILLSEISSVRIGSLRDSFLSCRLRTPARS